MSVSGRAPGGRGAGSPLGWLPAIALCAAVGLLLCTIDQSLSRETLDPPLGLYWLGLLLIGAPIFYRLTAEAASPWERLALVVLLGVALYAVKVVRDPFAFGFSDEPVHAFNADQIAETGRLFSHNSLLRVTPFYPGLESATAALMSLTGLSSFGAGLIVVGAARVLMMVALFTLFLRVSGSARAAGLGTAVYVGSFNFLYFSAQYSYESLSLPLFVTVLAAIADRAAGDRERVRSWAVPLAILIAAIVVVHHVTSYALIITLAALSLLSWRLRRDVPNPWPYAVLALGLTTGWLVVVASTTVGYLKPVFTRAFNQTLDTIQGAAGPRSLFESGTGGGSSTVATPLLGKVVALGAILILLAAAVLGLRSLWPRLRRDPFLLLFAAASLGFFASLLLRFVPAAWETGNRASGFLFVGLAFVAVFALVHPYIVRLRERQFRALVTGALAVVMIGGVISGWPWDLHLQLPSRASAHGHRIDAEPAGLGQWVGEHLPDGRFGSPAADARTIQLLGNAYVIAGRSPNIEGILSDPLLAFWQVPLLRKQRLRYVVADLRNRSEDAIRGYAFSVRPPVGPRDSLRPLRTRWKFQKIPASARIYDSGRIVLYDLRAHP